MRPDGENAYLWDMRQAASHVLDFVRNVSKEDFLASIELQSAVERQLEIIGEAASRVPKERRESAPLIPWPEIIGQRNVLIHGYVEIDPGLIWDVITRDLRPLIEQLNEMLGYHTQA
jgi:uncharacterized protein with HEPN domain